MSDSTAFEDESLQIVESDKDTQVVPMVLISQEQRNALIEYLAKMPYQDVAAGINFLQEAPMVNVNINVRKDNAED
ncbi:hypothetical protein KBY99_03005 [Cyanobium sp. Maggiore-St4-Cus]|uniref:hypothetical protein n=1 Tax=Cyanobium sp. Maggiore-St4-Cus TaxID=2823717 RepID=UPI0020CB7F46|nr:hypothetical protein [Cyanobium sp. Maggiore-St4-Cus]MCP9787948.1 hypothetical protein [Cyanobium sp. Maggiore-St4-Cus]